MVRRAWGAWALLLGLAAAGCGDDSDGDADSGTPVEDAGDYDPPMVDSGPPADTDAGGGDGSGEDCDPATTTEDALMAYGAAWGEADADARACLLAKAMPEDGSYVDPLATAADREEVSAVIQGSFDMFGSVTIDFLSGFDQRDGELRFQWDFLVAGASLITGADYIELTDDGRIQSVTGFFDPAADDPAEGAIAAWQDAWNATDADAGMTALGDALADGARYTDGENDVTGAEAIAGLIADAHADGDLTLTISGVDAHGMGPSYARVTLGIEPAGGDPIEATDYVKLDADGKITRIARFEGDFPAP